MLYEGGEEAACIICALQLSLSHPNCLFQVSHMLLFGHNWAAEQMLEWVEQKGGEGEKKCVSPPDSKMILKNNFLCTYILLIFSESLLCVRHYARH